MSDNKSNLNCCIPRNVVIKIPGLLPMLYTPREIAEDLGVPESTFRDWLNHGAPHIRDESNHIWINGHEFAAWVDDKRKVRKKSVHRLQDGEGFCMYCKKVVKIQNGEIRPIKGHLSHLTGICPDCGGVVNRGIWNAESAELSRG